MIQRLPNIIQSMFVEYRDGSIESVYYSIYRDSVNIEYSGYLNRVPTGMREEYSVDFYDENIINIQFPKFNMFQFSLPIDLTFTSVNCLELWECAPSIRILKNIKDIIVNDYSITVETYYGVNIQKMNSKADIILWV